MRFNGMPLLFLALLAISISSCSISSPVSRSETTPRKRLSREDMFRGEVVAIARNQVGTRYKYAGKDPRGFDCSGLTHYVFRQKGIVLSPSSRMQEKEGRSISVRSVKPGDLIFFRRSKLGKVFHVALVVSNDREGLRVVHSTSRGVVVDNISQSSYWKPKISTARDVISGQY